MPSMTHPCVIHHPPPLSDDINIVVAMKAMGADSDQEVVSLVGQEEALQALLLPSLQVGVRAGGVGWGSATFWDGGWYFGGIRGAGRGAAGTAAAQPAGGIMAGPWLFF